MRISPFVARVRQGGAGHLPLAEQLGAALRARSAGESAAPRAVSLAVPTGTDLDDDVTVLVELSRALRTE